MRYLSALRGLAVILTLTIATISLTRREVSDILFKGLRVSRQSFVVDCRISSDESPYVNTGRLSNMVLHTVLLPSTSFESGALISIEENQRILGLTVRERRTIVC